MAAQFKLADAFVQFSSQGKEKVDKDIEGVKGGVLGLSSMTGSVLKGNLLSQAIGKSIELLKAGLVGIVSSAAEAELAHVRFAQAVRNAGDSIGFTRQELEMLIASEARRTGDSRVGQEQAMAAILRYRNVQGGVLAEAFKASNELAAGLGTSNVDAARQLGMALEDPVSGMRMMRSLGVVFTEGQRKAIDGMVEQGNLLGAQRVILERINGTYGGMVEVVNGTLADAWADLKTSVMELGEAIGMFILPALKWVVNIINDAVRGFMDLFSAINRNGGLTFDYLLFKTRDWILLTIDVWRSGWVLIWDMFVFRINAMVQVAGFMVENIWTLFRNLGTNIAALFAASRDWLAGKGFSAETIGLTEGMKGIDDLKDKIGELPSFKLLKSEQREQVENELDKIAAKWARVNDDATKEFSKRAGIGPQAATKQEVKSKIEVEIPKLLMGIRAADLGGQFQRMVSDGEAKTLKANEATAANTKATADKIGQLADAATGPGIKIANMGWA